MEDELKKIHEGEGIPGSYDDFKSLFVGNDKNQEEFYQDLKAENKTDLDYASFKAKYFSFEKKSPDQTSSPVSGVASKTDTPDTPSSPQVAPTIASQVVPGELKPMSGVLSPEAQAINEQKVREAALPKEMSDIALAQQDYIKAKQGDPEAIKRERERNMARYHMMPDAEKQKAFAAEDARAAESAKLYGAQPLTMRMLDHYKAKVGGEGGSFIGDVTNLGAGMSREDRAMGQLEQQLKGTPLGAEVEQRLQKIYKATDPNDKRSLENAALDAKGVFLDLLGDKDNAIWDDYAKTNANFADYDPNGYHDRLNNQIKATYESAGIPEAEAYKQLHDAPLARGVMDEERTEEAQLVSQLDQVGEYVRLAEESRDKSRIEKTKAQYTDARRAVDQLRNQRLADVDSKIRQAQQLLVDPSTTDEDRMKLKEGINKYQSIKNGFMNPNAVVEAKYALYETQANAALPGGTPMQQLKKLFAELEFDRRQIVARITKAEGGKGDARFAAQELINSVGGGGHNDDHARLVQLDAQIADLAPIVYLNESPELHANETGFMEDVKNMAGKVLPLAGGVPLALGIMGGAYDTNEQAKSGWGSTAWAGMLNTMGGKGSPLNSTTKQEDARELMRNLQVAGVQEAAINPTSMEFLKERGKEPGLLDRSYQGNLVGTSFGLMFHIMLAAEATRGLGLAKTFASLTKAANFGKKGTTILAMLGDAIESGVNYETAGQLSVDNNDELSFAGGFLGGASAGLGKMGFNKASTVISKMFGDKAGEAAKVIAGWGARRVGAGVGETFEETGQQLVQMWNQSNTGTEFWNKMKEQFGDLSEASKFVISTFTMGSIMGAGNSDGLGAHLLEMGEQQLQQLPPEERQETQAALDQMEKERAALEEASRTEVDEQASKKQQLKDEARALANDLASEALGDDERAAAEERLKEIDAEVITMDEAKVQSGKPAQAEQAVPLPEAPEAQPMEVGVYPTELAPGKPPVEVAGATITPPPVEGGVTTMTIEDVDGDQFEAPVDMAQLIADMQSVYQEHQASSDAFMDETPVEVGVYPSAEPVQPTSEAKPSAVSITSKPSASGRGFTGDIVIDGKPQGHYTVETHGDTAHLADIQIGYDEQQGKDLRGKGHGIEAYKQIAAELAKQGVTLTSTNFGENATSISPQALSVWEKLVKQGLARVTGQAEGVVLDRFTGSREVKQVNTYEYINPKTQDTSVVDVTGQSTAIPKETKKRKPNPNRKAKAKPAKDLTPAQTVEEVAATTIEAEENPTPDNLQRAKDVEQQFEANIDTAELDAEIEADSKTPMEEPATEPVLPAQVTPEEKKVAKELNITEDEARDAKAASPKRSRKSKSVVETVEDQAIAAIAGGDAEAAAALVETIDGATEALLTNTIPDASFEDSYGVSEVALAAEYNSLGKNATIEQAYKNLTGNPLAGNGRGYSEQEQAEFKAFVTKFLNALGREGIKLKTPIEIDGKVELDLNPKPAKPIKKTGIDSLDTIVSGDESHQEGPLSSVFIDGDNYVATDAHQLVVIRRKDSDASVIDKMKAAAVKFLSKRLGLKAAETAAETIVAPLRKDGIAGRVLNMARGAVIDAKFPMYQNVIPQHVAFTPQIPIQHLIDLVNGAEASLRNIGRGHSAFIINFSGDKDVHIGFNPKNLLANLQALQANGATSVKLGADRTNRALTIQAQNGNLGLVMPIMLHGSNESELSRTKPLELTLKLDKAASEKQIKDYEKELKKSPEDNYLYEEVVKAKEKAKKFPDSKDLAETVDYYQAALDKSEKERIADLKDKIAEIRAKIAAQETTAKTESKPAEPISESKSDPGVEDQFVLANVRGDRTEYRKKDGVWEKRTHKPGTKVRDQQFVRDWEQVEEEEIPFVEKMSKKTELDREVLNSAKEWVAAWGNFVTGRGQMRGNAFSKIDLGVTQLGLSVTARTFKLGLAIARNLAAKGKFTYDNWRKSMLHNTGGHAEPFLATAWDQVTHVLPEGSTDPGIQSNVAQPAQETAPVQEESKKPKPKEQPRDTGDKTGTQVLMEKHIEGASKALASLISRSPMLKGVYDQQKVYEDAVAEVRKAIKDGTIGELMGTLRGHSPSNLGDVHQFQRMALISMYGAMATEMNEQFDAAMKSGDKAAQKDAEKKWATFTDNMTEMVNAMDENALLHGRAGAASGMWATIGRSMDAYAISVINKANQKIMDKAKAANGKPLAQATKEAADKINEAKKKAGDAIADDVAGAVDNGVENTKAGKEAKRQAIKDAKKRAIEKFNNIHISGSMNIGMGVAGLEKLAAAAEVGYYTVLEGALVFSDWVASMKKDLPDLEDSDLEIVWNSNMNGRTLAEESAAALKQRAVDSVTRTLENTTEPSNRESSKEVRKLRDQMAKDLSAMIAEGKSMEDFKKKHGLSDEQAESLAEAIQNAPQENIDKLAGTRANAAKVKDAAKSYLPEAKKKTRTHDAKKAELKKRIKEIIRDHFKNGDGTPLLDKLVAAGLDIDQATKVDQAVKDSAQRIMQQAVAGELDYIVSGESRRAARDKSQQAKKEAREFKPPKKGKKRTQTEILIDRLVDNDITDRYIQGMVAHQFGLGTMPSPEQITQLRKLGEAVQGAEAGSVLEKHAMNELAKIMDEIMPRTKTEELMALWRGTIMASLLNSASTFGVNLYSISDHFFMGLVRALTDLNQWSDFVHALVRHDGNAMLLNPLAKTFVKMSAGVTPFTKGFTAFLSAISTGVIPAKYDESIKDTKAGSMLPSLERKQRTRFGKAITGEVMVGTTYKGKRYEININPYAGIFGKLVGRILASSDAGMTTMYGDYEYLDAMRQAVGRSGGDMKTLKKHIGEYLSTQSKLWKDSMAQAEAEAAGMSALTGKPVDDATIKVRAREIARKKYAGEVGLTDSELHSVQMVAQYNSLTLKRQGMFGHLATAIGKVKGSSKVVEALMFPFFLFTEIPGNFGDAVLDNTPVYNIFRVMGATPSNWKIVQKWTKTETGAALGEAGSRERRKQWESVFFSNAMMLVAWALLGGDDDDKALSANENRLDDSYQVFGIPYKSIPALAPALIFAKVLRDFEKNPVSKMDSPVSGTLGRLMAGGEALAGFYTDQTFMKGLKDLGKVMTTGLDAIKGDVRPESAIRAVIRPYLNLAVKPLPENQGIIKFIEDCFDPTKYTDEDMAEMFIMSMGLERTHNQRRVGLFGEDYTQYPGYNVLNVKSLIDKVADGKNPYKAEYQFLAKTNTVIEAPRNSIAKFLDKDSPTGFTFREFTPEEWRKYNQEAGKKFLEGLRGYMNEEYANESEGIAVKGNKFLPSVQKSILKIWSDSRNEAKKELFGDQIINDGEAQGLLNDFLETIGIKQ